MAFHGSQGDGAVMGGVLFPDDNPSLFSDPRSSRLFTLYCRFSPCSAIVSPQAEHTKEAGGWFEQPNQTSEEGIDAVND